MTSKFQPRDEDIFPDNDVEGHGGKFPAAPETTEDVEGHGGRFPVAPETTDDV